MTPLEAALLLTYVSALDNRTVEPEHGQAWADVLDPRLTLPGAKWIVNEHYKTSRQWLMPSDINTKFLKVRRERIDVHGNQIPYPLDLHPDRHIEFRKAWEDAVGNDPDADAHAAATVACHQIGHTPEPAKLVGPPPTLEKFMTKIKETAEQSA